MWLSSREAAERLFAFLIVLAVANGVDSKVSALKDSNSENSRLSSAVRKRNNIVLVYHDSVVFHLIGINTCTEIIIQAKRENKAFTTVQCTEFNYNKFRASPLKPRTRYSIRVRKKNKKRVIFSDTITTIPSKNSYAPVAPMEYEEISAGPGWIEIRFQAPNHDRKCLLGYKLQYKKQNDIDFYSSFFVGYPDYSAAVPQMLPLIPCPPWYRRRVMCLLVTDFVRPDTSGRAVVYNIKVEAACFKQDKPSDFPHELQKRSFSVARVKPTMCDPTTSSCSIDGWNRLITLISAPFSKVHQASSGTILPEASERDVTFSDIFELFWLYFLIVLLILLVLLLCTYALGFKIGQKREARRWHVWSTANRSLIVALRLSSKAACATGSSCQSSYQSSYQNCR